MKQFIGSFDVSMIQNIDEFVKRYQNTWLEVESVERKTKDVFQFKGCEADKLVFNNDKYGKVNIQTHTSAIIRPIMLNIRVINTSSGAKMLFRLPVRRNQRSLSDKNTKIVDVVKYAFTKIQESLVYSDIRDALYNNNTYPSLKEALDSKKDSVAFSTEYSIVKDAYGNTYLYYLYVPIGTYVSGVFVIDRHYIQEFKDYLRDNQLNEYAREYVE